MIVMEFTNRGGKLGNVDGFSSGCGKRCRFRTGGRHLAAVCHGQKRSRPRQFIAPTAHDNHGIASVVEAAETDLWHGEPAVELFVRLVDQKGMEVGERAARLLAEIPVVSNDGDV